MIVAPPGAAPACVPLPVVGCVVSGVVGGTGGGLGGAAGSIAGGVFSVFVGYLADAGGWLVTHLIGLAGPQADPNLDASWFQAQMPAIRVVVEAGVVPLLMVATIGAVLRQDLKRLGRIWGVGVPVAVTCAVAGVVLAKYTIGFTDALTASVAGHGGLDVAPALAHLSFDGAAAGSPILVTAAVYLLAIVGAVFIWLELVLRQSAIYVVMFFMPLALATYVWPASAGVARRTVQILFALILSKFVIFTTIALGLAAVRADSPLDQQFAGAGILLLASFAPFALMKLAPIVEVAAIAHLEGMSHRPFRAASRASAAVASPSHPVVRTLMSAGSGSSPPSGPAQVISQPLAQRAPDYPTSTDYPMGPGGSERG